MSLIAIQSRLMAASLTLRRAFAALPNPSGDQSKFYDVPEGHSDSDLSQTACNIGLNRRRDLTIGACGKIKLTIDGNETTLAELLAGKLGQQKLTAMFGVPDRGSVCTSKHVPSYLKQLDALRKQGVDQIICVSRGEPAAGALLLLAAAQAERQPAPGAQPGAKTSAPGAASAAKRTCTG